jgi:cytochrome c5
LLGSAAGAASFVAGSASALLAAALWLCIAPTVALGDNGAGDNGPAAVTDLKTGQEVYVAVCSSCHDEGLAGAPKIGDKAAWAARLSEGMGLLYLHSLKGYHGKAGVMPARGGRADLSVELVKKSVDYMVARSN